jgi:hypothetical protein
VDRHNCLDGHAWPKKTTIAAGILNDYFHRDALNDLDKVTASARHRAFVSSVIKRSANAMAVVEISASGATNGKLVEGRADRFSGLLSRSARTYAKGKARFSIPANEAGFPCLSGRRRERAISSVGG